MRNLTLNDSMNISSAKNRKGKQRADYVIEPDENNPYNRYYKYFLIAETSIDFIYYKTFLEINPKFLHQPKEDIAHILTQEAMVLILNKHMTK